MSDRHEVARDDVECLGFVCGRCGEPVDGDGDSFWHRDPNLNPHDEEASDD